MAKIYSFSVFGWVLFCTLFISTGVNAQQLPCAFDYRNDLFRSTDPDFKNREDVVNRALYSHALGQQQGHKSTSTILQIPTVVHVMHYNGPENLSDSVVLAAIDHMNLRFQNAAPYYDATGNPMNIQFCLASIDPQGNPTNGVTHDSTTLTFLNASNDVQMKNLNRWDPLSYFNIWTVNQIYGFNISVAGYSSLPSNLGDDMDGVVLLAGSVNSYVLTHEAGHFLGLYHTFNSFNCDNFNCLLDGDMVCDTPPDTSMSGCMGNSCISDANDTTGLGPFTSDVDELPNYMDYSTCTLSFSAGQGERMSDAITYIRSQLLVSPGCGFNGSALPTATMSYSISSCHDGIVHFSDSLSVGVGTVNWDFNNDGIFDSFKHNPDFTYPATGTYTVKLLIVNQGGVDSVMQNIFVQKAPTLYYPIENYNGIFTNIHGNLASCGNYTIYCEGPPGATYLWSTGDTTQSISFVPDSSFVLTLQITDSTGLVWNNQLCHPLAVTVQPMPPQPYIYTNDSLIICDGDSVIFHADLDSNYTYTWYQNSSATNVHDSTFTAIGYFPGVPYQLIVSDTNWCYNYSNILYLNSYNAPAMQSLTQNSTQLISGWGDGNQWYLNGVPIPGANGMTYNVTQPGCYSVAWYFSFVPQCVTMSDTICFLTVGVNELSEASDFIISPNPSKGIFHITSIHSSKTISFAVKDLLGNTLLSGEWDHPSNDIDISGLADGMYILEIKSAESTSVLKLLKEE